MGFLIFFQFNFAHFSRTSNVKICIDRENSYWDDEFFSYYTRQIFCLDASFWYFSHLLICNFNAKLKLLVPPNWIKINEKLIGENFLKITNQSCKRYFDRIDLYYKTTDEFCSLTTYLLLNWSSTVKSWKCKNSFLVSRSGQDMSANKKWF